MAATLPPRITLNNDSAESVQKAALNYFKASTFTSYTEVTPEDSVMMLVLGQKDNQEGEALTFYLDDCVKKQCLKKKFRIFFPP